MAKNKEYEKEYKAEGKRRISRRQQLRKNKWTENVRKYGRGGPVICRNCGNHMRWCNTCEVWSQDCCIDWGTCQCS